MKDKLLELAAQFKLGQKVFVYVAPGHVNAPENSPVWGCEITEITATRKVVVNDDNTCADKDESSIELKLDYGWDSIRRGPESVFVNLEDAKAHAMSEFEALFAKRAAYADVLNLAMENLDKQDENSSFF